MDFLKNKGFTNEEILLIVNKYEESLDTLDMISCNIEDVIDYFNSYGVRNIPKLMYDRIDIFYLPVEYLRKIFSHYNREYLIESLDKDASCFDMLS